MNHPEKKNIKKTVCIFGCKYTTLELIKRLIKNKFQVDYCITITPEKAIEQKVAGYIDLEPFLQEYKIPVKRVSKYNLDSKEDKEILKSLHIDIIFCMGWQRLIPEWLLNNLSVGAFGMHGSNKPLPHGRGRSPLNWSLIQNKKIFFTHLFQYLPGVDDGPIIGCLKFDINPWDDCNTLHLKNLLAMSKLCEKHLPDLLENKVNSIPQNKIEPSYFPKRSMEDGIIFWEDSMIDIYNLIRAVTKPFPGAFSFINNDKEKKIIIWNAIPFDTRLEWENKTYGEILEIFNDGTFIVMCADGVVLIKEYTYENKSELIEGNILGSSDYIHKIYNLPR